jgi:hypothetical protein
LSRPLVGGAEQLDHLPDLLRPLQVHAHPVGLGEDVVRSGAPLGNDLVVEGVGQQEVGQGIAVEMT